MAKLTNGQIEIELAENEHELRVLLEASQYDLKGMEHYAPFLEKSDMLFEGQIKQASEENVELIYTIPEYAVSVANYVSANKSDLERLEIARKFSGLASCQTKIICPFIHPDNLYIMSGQLKVAHRGLLQYIQPDTQDYADFITQYKALVISTLQPKYKFELLVAGTLTVRDPLSKEILESATLDEIEKLLDRQYQALRLIQNVSKRLVNKALFTAQRVALVIFALSTIGLVIWLGVSLGETVPRQERIIESHAAFMVNNYNQVAAILSEDPPQVLPRSVQYMLAASFVQLENLSSAQRTVILNNMSPSSNENELLYWIFIGRGEFETALDIALNIGDNQLILHVYTKLYDFVYADHVMDGAEKQRLLDEYRGRIDELLEIFAEDEDEDR